MNTDDWHNALLALTGVSERERNSKPLVRLLRSNAPIPQGIRAALADMLDPDCDDGFSFFRLEGKSTESKRNNFAKDLKKMEILAQYEERLAKGERSEVVVGELSKKFSVNERTVFNYVEEARELRNWLRCGK